MGGLCDSAAALIQDTITHILDSDEATRCLVMDAVLDPPLWFIQQGCLRMVPVPRIVAQVKGYGPHVDV